MLNFFFNEICLLFWVNILLIIRDRKLRKVEKRDDMMKVRSIQKSELGQEIGKNQ